MIVSLSVSNFRSFDQEETLSLVASNRLGATHEHHLAPIPNSKERVLRTAVMYGANAAGKSNLFKALAYVRSMALETRGKDAGTEREPFVLAARGEVSRASSFDLQFIAGEAVYQFGFKVSDAYVLEEWLIQVRGTRERVIYERTTDSKGTVTVDPKGLKKAGEKLLALATVGGPPNQTFLATARATLAETDIGEELARVLEWFRRRLRLVEPEASIAPVGHMLATDSDFRDFASDFLKSSSTGVENVEATREEISEGELRKLLPKSLVTRLLEMNSDEAILSLPDGKELVLEKDSKSFFRIAVRAAHKAGGASIQLEFDQESDGTRRLLNLIPALHEMKCNEGVYVIDEIDRSLHPILAWNFLNFFLKSCGGGRNQIILTTHESNLLDLELLRRDEIWFAEKDDLGATRLYSLVDFKVRSDLEIRKHYLQGRFGAVPFLGNLDKLLAEATRGHVDHQ